MENYIIANRTDTGKVRNVNEDSMTTFDSPNGRVVVVCDGMGGQKAGDVASQLAVAVIQDLLTDNTFATPEDAITRSIVAANQAILRRASQNEGLSGMGSTCVMLIIRDGQVYYGSVGDSRIYYVANHAIHQITKDESYVQSLVDAGQISQEEAEHHKDKNQITNALGLEGMTPPVVCQLPIIPEAGSVFVLCSDGLSGMINNDAILHTVTRYDMPLKERADLLVRQANEAGGLDNITVQLVEFPAGGMGAISNGGFSSTYVQEEKKQKSHTILYSFLFVVLVAVAGGGAYWYMNREEPEETKPAVSVKKSQTKPMRQTDPTRSEEEEPAAPTEMRVITVKENKTEKRTQPQTKSSRTLEKKVIAKEVKQAIAKQATEKSTPRTETIGKEVKQKVEEAKSSKREKRNGIVYEDLKAEKAE